jgi:hypothetical protein
MTERVGEQELPDEIPAKDGADQYSMVDHRDHVHGVLVEETDGRP